MRRIGIVAHAIRESVRTPVSNLAAERLLQAELALVAVNQFFLFSVFLDAAGIDCAYGKAFREPPFDLEYKVKLDNGSTYYATLRGMA